MAALFVAADGVDLVPSPLSSSLFGDCFTGTRFGSKNWKFEFFIRFLCLIQFLPSLVAMKVIKMVLSTFLASILCPL